MHVFSSAFYFLSNFILSDDFQDLRASFLICWRPPTISRPRSLEGIVIHLTTMPGKTLSSDLKERICKAWEEDQTISYSRLAERFSVNKTTAYQLIKRYKERGSFEDAKKTGRPRITSKRTDRRIVRESKQDPFKCAT